MSGPSGLLSVLQNGFIAQKPATEPMGRKQNARGNRIAVAASAKQAANQAVKASRQGIAWQLKKAVTVVPQPPE